MLAESQWKSVCVDSVPRRSFHVVPRFSIQSSVKAPAVLGLTPSMSYYNNMQQGTLYAQWPCRALQQAAQSVQGCMSVTLIHQGKSHPFHSPAW